MRWTSAVVVVSALSSSLVVLPTVTVPAAAARPVQPSVDEHELEVARGLLAGVDPHLDGVARADEQGVRPRPGGAAALPLDTVRVGGGAGLHLDLGPVRPALVRPGAHLHGDVDLVPVRLPGDADGREVTRPQASGDRHR